MATRRRIQRLGAAEAARLLRRAQSWANYGFVCFVDRPVTRDEIDAMDPPELRALVRKYNGQMAGPTTREALAILDEIEGG